MVKKIILHPEGIRRLADEFTCSKVTVYQSLRYTRDSPLSYEIRARALALGGQEIVIPELKRKG